MKRQHVLDVIFYIVFFPKLLEGPLHKADDFFEQLKIEHSIKWDNLVSGMQIFLFGFIKKTVIADRLGLFVDTVYMTPGAYSGATLLLTALTYPIQLYCDFSGYSDMAVGVAKMMGFDLCQNFNLPFMATTVSEYWRRWHMSLNVWFRDYLFYSILRSGWVNSLRKKAKLKYKGLAKVLPAIIGMIIVWPLIGLWHGATGNFIIYGSIYGLFMIIGLLVDTYGKGNRKQFSIPGLIRTWFITIFTMIIFRAEDMRSAFTVIRGIVTWQPGISYLYTWTLIYVPVVMLLSMYAYRKNQGNGFYLQLDLKLLHNKVTFCAVIFFTLILMYVGENYFMYFRF